MEGVNGFDYTKDRINDSQLNANMVAYHTIYLTYSIYVIPEIIEHEKVKRWTEYSFFLILPFSFIVAFLTGSRQVLLIQIPLFFLLLATRYYSQLKRAKFFLVALFAFAAVSFFAINKGKEIYENSFLATRYEKTETSTRPAILADAIKVGCEHPVLGVGPGNYVKFSFDGHFSHCTYTELFANCGIFAFLFYVYMLWVFIKKQYQYYRETKDKLFLSFLVFGLIFAFDNIFYVFYYKLWLISFFFLVASHSEYYYREKTTSLS